MVSPVSRPSIHAALQSPRYFVLHSFSTPLGTHGPDCDLVIEKVMSVPSSQRADFSSSHSPVKPLHTCANMHAMLQGICGTGTVHH